MKRALFVMLMLIAAYLVLVHAGGFATDIQAIASAGGGLAKTLQGR
jgi:hypothetical protein